MMIKFGSINIKFWFLVVSLKISENFDIIIFVVLVFYYFVFYELYRFLIYLEI